ncbi:MAG: Asd/ArgC dimerization domain-containing protein [Myxococcota bacterium]
MSSELRVAVAGATGALGGEILRVLDQVSWRPTEVSALARQTTATSHVDYGDDRLPVDVAERDTLQEVDVVFVATPREAGGPLVSAGAQAGALVVDCSGALAGDPAVPLVVPWVNPEALAGIAAGVVAVPWPGATLLASALGPLRRAGVVGPTSATVLLPASAEGREGIEELSRQVVALFNSGTPPRKVFPDGLAFDLLPTAGEADESGWTELERRTVDETVRVAGIPEGLLDVTLIRVPVFSGCAAHVVVRPERPVPPELVLRILTDGGVRPPEAAGARYQPRPRRVEGKPFVHVGWIRPGADGRSLHLWVAMDNLRTTATAAVAAAGALLRGGGQLEGAEAQ